MDPVIVRDVHMAINMAHRFVYFVPEAAEEYAAIGVTGRGGYFGPRAAPMGAVPDEVVLATFYNFSPRAVSSAMPGVWESASPEALQAARFRVVRRALERVGAHLTPEHIAEATAILASVVARLECNAVVNPRHPAARLLIVSPSQPVIWDQRLFGRIGS